MEMVIRTLQVYYILGKILEKQIYSMRFWSDFVVYHNFLIVTQTVASMYKTNFTVLI